MRLTLKRSRLCAIFEYLFVLILIIDCRSLWQRLSITPSWFNIATWVLLIGFAFGAILTNRKLKAKSVTKMCLIILFGAAYVVFFILIRPQNIGNFLKLGIATIIMAIYVIDRKDNYMVMSLLMKYRNIVLLIAIISLFFWFFGSTLGVVKNTGYVYTDWDTVYSPKVPSYFHMYYTTQRVEVFGVFIFRNTAIFTEAPMASYHFSIAFLISFLFERESKWKYILLIITIFTTFSFTGYILLILAYLFNLVFSKSKKSIVRFFKIIMLPLCVLICILFVFYLYVLKRDSASGIARIMDFVNGFNLWKNNILFGYGYRSEAVSHVGYSNSVIPVLTQGGLYFVVFYSINLMIGFYNAIVKNNKSQFIFITLFMYLVVITNVAFQHLTLFVFLCLGSMYQKEIKSEIHKAFSKKIL